MRKTDVFDIRYWFLSERKLKGLQERDLFEFSFSDGRGFYDMGVTSVALTMPASFNVAGSPITSSGTFVVTLASGYVIPTSAQLSSFVPYTGATQDVNLNVQRLIADTILGFSAEGLLIQDHTVRDIALFKYSSTALTLFSPTDYLMEFNQTTSALRTNYVMNPSMLETVGLSANIGSFGLGENYLYVKYNDSDTDWGKVLYQASDGYIRSPMALIASDYNFNLDVGFHIFQAGDLLGLTSGASIYVDGGGGQVAFGNISTGDNFYWDAGTGNLFSFSGENRYVLQGSAMEFRYDTRINMAGTFSTTADGDLWHDSTRKAYTAYQNGIQQSFDTTLFTQMADKPVANTTTETSLVGTGTGTVTLPASFFVGSKTVSFTLRGYKSATATPNITIKIKLGSAVIATTGAIASTNGTDYGWVVSGILTCRTTGTTGTVSCSGEYIEIVSGGAIAGIIQTGTTTINTTTSQLIDITAQWGTANASNTITSQVVKFEVKN